MVMPAASIPPGWRPGGQEFHRMPTVFKSIFHVQETPMAPSDPSTPLTSGQTSFTKRLLGRPLRAFKKTLKAPKTRLKGAAHKVAKEVRALIPHRPAGKQAADPRTTPSPASVSVSAPRATVAPKPLVRMEQEHSPLARAAHVRRLRAADPDLHPPVGCSEALVNAGEDAPVYRLLPITGVESARDTTARAIRAAMASTLHQAAQQSTGIDFCLPRATIDGSRKSPRESPVVIVDAVVGAPLAASYEEDPPDRQELQRALLGQWILGRPTPDWSDFERGPDGGIVAREFTTPEGSLRDICRAADSGVSKLFRTPDGQKVSPLAGQPLEGHLRDAILRLQRLDVEKALVHGKRELEGHLPDDMLLSLKLVPQLLAPLRALKRAVEAADPRLPLEMLMRDAANCLEDIEAREFRR
jgi:hypothetical protein